MKIKDIYEKAYKRGMELDPRGMDEVNENLKQAKKDYEALSDGRKKNAFDVERMNNPYADTRILNGDPETDVKRILVGIDIEVGEIVMADRLKDKGQQIDMVLAHHPEGRAMASLYDVMEMQSGILNRYGVPIHVAENLMAERISEVERRLKPANHTRAVDAAKLFDIPFMCVHTPTDNAVTTYLQDLFDKEEPRYISDVLDMLSDIQEYEGAATETVGPSIVVGGEKRRAGKIFVDMTGGTGGSSKIYDSLSNAGVSTIVGMHIGEEHRKEAEKYHIDVVLAGHISSDTLGINLLLDDILDDDVEVVSCSGFRRISRKK
ncbi:MAG: NGG1p interacting factor NIF3 [Deltaproteobacteria bacterium]|nr:NGG1p interacting factor NIF3 [Deltaproteobacteria bacterium]